jgi:3-oxoacyl-[acyl-carrier-protein] synthase-3
MSLIAGISYYLPQKILTNKGLSEIFPEWSESKIFAKTGISERHIADDGEFVSTMAVKAAEKLFLEYDICRNNIDFLLLCTQSPDYFLPTTACLVQNELNLPKACGAFDFNLGCSGFVYGLSLAKALIISENYKNVLLITSETYSKYLDKNDKGVRTIFGDAASATLITNSKSTIGKFIFGTDGSGGDKLIVENGALRSFNSNKSPTLYMSGPDIFTFTLDVVPQLVFDILKKNDLTIDNIDLFIFHQANKFMLDHLKEKLKIEDKKFFISMSNCGNTVSSTIPIAIKEAQNNKVLKPNMKVLIAGFGVGYSWGGTIINF